MTMKQYWTTEVWNVNLTSWKSHKTIDRCKDMPVVQCQQRSSSWAFMPLLNRHWRPIHPKYVTWYSDQREIDHPQSATAPSPLLLVPSQDQDGSVLPIPGKLKQWGKLKQHLPVLYVRDSSVRIRQGAALFLAAQFPVPGSPMEGVVWQSPCQPLILGASLLESRWAAAGGCFFPPLCSWSTGLWKQLPFPLLQISDTDLRKARKPFPKLPKPGQSVQTFSLPGETLSERNSTLVIPQLFLSQSCHVCVWWNSLNACPLVVSTRTVIPPGETECLYPAIAIIWMYKITRGRAMFNTAFIPYVRH